jgi:hypothetical protein
MNWLVLDLPNLRDDSLKILRHGLRFYFQHRAASVDDPVVPVLQSVESGAALAKSLAQKSLRPVSVNRVARHLFRCRYPQTVTLKAAD